VPETKKEEAMKYLSALGLLAIAAGAALGQNTTITNPSFEDDDPSGATDPLGWIDFNASSSASTQFAHTGQRSLRMVFGTSNFAGISTNYFDTNTFEFPYDPTIVFLGGDLTISGWYLIPQDTPINGASWASLKLEVRRTVNNSVYQGFEWPVITGHTNGEWVFFERTVHNEDFGNWPLPPPTGGITRCSVLAIMFDPNGVNPTPAIYWDDLHLTQEGACYPDCDTSTGVGVLDIFDFLCFQNLFATNDPYACDCDTSTGPNVCDIFDFLCFQNEFAAGCP
jgi:hypothetical protein